MFDTPPAPPLPDEPPAIIVTAGRETLPAEHVPSASQMDGRAIESLGLPMLPDLLRLFPGVSLAASGPRGSQAQLRIRGAEANHSLLFVDRIRFNDPASGNEPRFELLSADLLSRIELVRGPQSALWGADALGGVVAAETVDPLAPPGIRLAAEAGSLDGRRLSGRVATRGPAAGLALLGGYQASDGIDAFGAGGDRDGYDNLSLGLKGAVRAGAVTLDLAAFRMEGRSEYDGTDPLTFRRADTSDETLNRLDAIRLGAEVVAGPWSGRADLSLVDSANRNRLDDAPLNASHGDRLALSGQVARTIGRHRLVLAVEHQEERFRAADTAFEGATAQRRRRENSALVGQWQAGWTDRFETLVALRHDRFSAFADATTLRASVQWRPAPAWRLHASYGEGIAQPTFYDLYGFFPGAFRGNPALRPERSQSVEAGLAFARPSWGVESVYHRSRLRDEIVDTFDPAAFLSGAANADGRSRRQGVELGGWWRPAPALRLALSGSWLDASEQTVLRGPRSRELRRPEYSLTASADGAIGHVRWGLGLAWVGPRRDMDFDAFPAARVRLPDYTLLSLQLSRPILPFLEATARIENALDADYQDVVGYRTAGRTVHAGLRLAFGA